MQRPELMANSEFDQLNPAPIGRGLNRSFLGVLLLSMLIPPMVSGFWLIRSDFKQSVAKDHIAAAQHHGNVLERGMAAPLWNLSPPMGRQLLESVSADKSVVSVKVQQETGEIFLTFQRTESVNAADVIEIERPVLYDEALVGSIKLSYSLERARETSVTQINLLVWVIFIQFAVVLLATFLFLHQKITKPLRGVLKAVEGIASGDLNKAVPKMGSSELATLSMRLEAMRIAMNDEIVMLEKRIDERTKGLSSLNASLRSSKDQLDYTFDALVQANRIASLNHILIMDKIVDGSECLIVEKQYFSLTELLSDTCKLLAPAIQRTPYKVRLDIDKNLKFDIESYPRILDQVFQNIISNALLHAFENRTRGELAISVKQKDDCVEICLADNGVGMPSEYQNKKMKENAQMDDKLGLYIIKKLTTKILGGEIFIESKQNIGTTVFVNFPIKNDER